MEKEVTTTGGGIGFCGALTIAFIVLKLCNVINWSWWWVVSPIWISIGVAILLVLIVLLLSAFACSTHDYDYYNF